MLLTPESLNPGNFWTELPGLSKLFAFFLIVVFWYSIYVLLQTLLRLRSLPKDFSSEASRTEVHSLQSRFQNRLDNLRQLLLFTRYLFVFCILLQMPYVFDAFGDYKTYPAWPMILRLAVLIEFAADVTLTFLFLHSFQWIVSYRLNSASRQPEQGMADSRVRSESPDRK